MKSVSVRAIAVRAIAVRAIAVRAIAVGAFVVAPIAILAPIASASDIPTYYDQTSSFANPGDPGSQNKPIIVSPWGTTQKIVCGGVTGNYVCHQFDPSGGIHNLVSYQVPSTSASGFSMVWVYNPAYL